MKTVREIINEVKNNNDKVFHKLLGNNVEICPTDWLRIYKGGDCTINKLIYACDWKDIDLIPEEILNIQVNFFNTWLIGGDLSLDCVILEEKYIEEYKNTELELRFV